MEIFIPSLALLLVGIAVAFFVVPMMAPTILVTGSAILLAVAVYVHYNKFGVSEYERATWFQSLKKHINYVILGAVLLGAYAFWAMNQGSMNAVLPTSVTENISSPALPPVTMPTVGGGFNSVFKTASSRIRELMRHGRITYN